MPVPVSTVILGLVLIAAALVSFGFAPRGGRFRGLPGWTGFWAVMAPLLVLLARAPRNVALAVLGALMFIALREYFFVVPLRARDRWAIMAAYLCIPLTLWPELGGSWQLFLTLVPVGLFLLLPVLLAVRSSGAGWFESLGRVLAGITAFVFAAAHLGLMVEGFERGQIELFGILVLAAELPQRLAGRVRPDDPLVRPVIGLFGGVVVALLAGFFAGPACGVPAKVAAAAGALLAVGTAAGALVADAVAQDLSLGAPSARLGRGAFLDRAFPAVYAAPVYVHFLALVATLP